MAFPILRVSLLHLLKHSHLQSSWLCRFSAKSLSACLFFLILQSAHLLPAALSPATQRLDQCTPHTCEGTQPLVPASERSTRHLLHHKTWKAHSFYVLQILIHDCWQDLKLIHVLSLKAAFPSHLQYGIIRKQWHHGTTFAGSIVRNQSPVFNLQFNFQSVLWECSANTI